MHFFIRRQTNGRTWRGRANQNPMRQQRPPIKRSLPKPPPPPSRIRELQHGWSIWHRSARWPYALCIYFEYTYLYAGFARSRSALRESTSIVPERHGPVIPFPPPSPLDWLPVRLKYEARWQLKSAGSSYNAVGLRTMPRERKPVNWKWGDRVTSEPELPYRGRVRVIPPDPLATWRIEFLSLEITPLPFLFPRVVTPDLSRVAS